MATGFLKSLKADVGSALSLTVGLGVLAGFLLIPQAWCLAHAVNAVIFAQQTLEDVMPWLWGMLALLLARTVLSYTSEQVAFRAAADVKQNLRERLFRRLRTLGPVWLQDQASGDLVTRLSDGVEALEAYYARYLPAMSLAALVPLSILGFLLPLDWLSALVMLLTAPLIPFFMILIGKGAERLNQRQWLQLTRMGGRFLAVIQGLTTLKLYNASRREAALLARVSEEYRLASVKVLRVAFLSALALEFFSTISIAIVAVLIGFRLLYGQLDFQTGFFVLLLAPEFYLPLRSLGAHYHARMEAIAAAEGLLEILQAPEIVSGTTGSSALPAAPLRVELRGVHFAYPGQRIALAGAEFEFRAGERIAIVGPSGSGKSTLLQLLLGFLQPQQGDIRINGHSLAQIDLAQWRQQLAWVPQRPRIFHGTVAQNIGLGLHEVSEERMNEALEKAQALAFVRQLPQGLNTLLGEAGRSLSGGQIQRLALARAFVREAELVLMDEPTANLDARSERLIGLAIDTLARQSTLLTVAHRLHTVKQADRILVLDQGKLVQQGRHDDLMRETGLYRQLIEASGGGL